MTLVAGSAPGTSLDLPAATLWRAARAPVLVGLVVLLVALVLALVRSGSSTGSLDPRAVDRGGSRAVAEVLRGQGVDVRLAETTDAAVAAAADPDATTVLVAFPDRLVEEQLERVEATGADLVLVSPGEAVLGALAPSLRAVARGDAGERDPGCALPLARRAGPAEVGGLFYAPSGAGPVALCYPEDGAGALAVVEDGDRSVTVVGEGTPFTNDRLDDAGNAALALGLLGGEETLVWYLPSLGDVPPGGQRSLAELVPTWVGPALAQTGVAVVLLALWQARRLGPVVTEPLPVVVRASEAVEGRARLYRRSRARGSAATALRRAALERMRPALRLPRQAPPEAVTGAVAARTGRSGDSVRDLLYGAPPGRDAALVALVDALDSLEREVRRS